jgi:hypothetical protein
VAHQAFDLREHRSGAEARDSEAEATIEQTAAEPGPDTETARRSRLRRLTAGAGAACRSTASLASSLDSIIGVVRSLVVSIAMIIAVGFGAFVVVKELRQRLLVIEPIQIPPALADLGYTSDNVARQLKEQISEIQTASTTLKELPLIATTADLPKIEIPEAQTSLQQVLTYLRTYIGAGETRFAGEMIGSETVPYTLYLRSEHGPLAAKLNPKLEGDARQKMMCVLHDAAEKIMEQTEPYVLAVALFAGRRDPAQSHDQCAAPAAGRDAAPAVGQDAQSVEDRIKRLLAKTLKSGRKEDRSWVDNLLSWTSFGRSSRRDDRPWVYNLRGLLLAEKGRVARDAPLADVKSAIGRLDKAIDDYKAAIKADSNFAIAYFNESQAYAAQGQLTAYAAKLSTDQSSTPEHLYQKARDLYQEAVTLAPDQSYFYAARGDTLYRVGRYHDAVDRYREAIDNNKNTKQFNDKLQLELRARLMCAQFADDQNNDLWNKNMRNLKNDYPTAKINGIDDLEVAMNGWGFCDAENLDKLRIDPGIGF